MRRKTELAFELQSIDDLALNLYLLILRIQLLVRLLLQLLLLQEQLRIFSVVILMFLFLLLLLILLFKGRRSGAKILIAAPVISFIHVFVLVEAVREYTFLRAVFLDRVWGLLTLYAYLNLFTPRIGIFGALLAGRRLVEVVESVLDFFVGRGVELRTPHIVW